MAQTIFTNLLVSHSSSSSVATLSTGGQDEIELVLTQVSTAAPAIPVQVLVAYSIDGTTYTDQQVLNRLMPNPTAGNLTSTASSKISATGYADVQFQVVNNDPSVDAHVTFIANPSSKNVSFTGSLGAVTVDTTAHAAPQTFSEGSTNGLQADLSGNLKVTVEGGSITVNTGSVTAAGTDGSVAQGIQGITGGVAVPVSGTVAVNNLPTTQAVSGSVTVSNFPSTQPISGSVTVSNFPSTQPVSGTVSIGNFPGTQPISGSVSVSTSAVYNSAAPTLTNATATALQADVNGNLKVNVSAGSLTASVTLPFSGTSDGQAAAAGQGISILGYNGATFDRLRSDSNQHLMTAEQNGTATHYAAASNTNLSAAGGLNIKDGAGRLFGLYNGGTADLTLTNTTQLQVNDTTSTTDASQTNCLYNLINLGIGEILTFPGHGIPFTTGLTWYSQAGLVAGVKIFALYW